MPVKHIFIDQRIKLLLASLLLICQISLLQGCVALSFGEQSIPSLDNAVIAKLGSNGILELPGLTLSIRPQNAFTRINIWGFILPFLPLPGTATRPSESFRIYLQLEPSNDEFSFDPGQVKIRIGQNEFNSQGFLHLGILSYELSESALQPSVVQLGHPWHCDDFDLQNQRVQLVKPAGPVLFQQRACFVLEFPVITPRPKQEFTVIIDGLKHNDQPVQVPPIHFRKKSRIMYESFMLQ